MGAVYAEITLKNAGDITLVKRGFTTEAEVRQVTVQSMVDTGAGTLVINEELRRKLGLGIEGTREAKLANDRRELCKITEPVEIHWKDSTSV